MALVSPGVEVQITDESAYGAPGAGTSPLIILATRENKTDPTGSASDGIAKYTKSAHAGEVVRVTSQREVTQFFGNPIFTTNSTDVVIQGSETSEYGLMAAYSYLGQGNTAYIVRADLDLAQLDHATTEPVAAWSTTNTHWLDTDASKYGIHEYNDTTDTWVNKIPSVEVISGVAGTAPTASVVTGGYHVVVSTSSNTIEYYRESGSAWVAVAGSATFAPHYNTPAAVGATTTSGIIDTVNNIGAADISRAPGTYNVTSGTASFTIVVDGTGAATVTVDNGGSGFTVGQTITILDGDLGTGGAADLTFDVATITSTTSSNPVDVWIKTTTPGNGIDLVVYEYETTGWTQRDVLGVGTGTSVTGYIPQNGSSSTALTASSTQEGKLVLDTAGNIIKISELDADSDVNALSTLKASVAYPTATATDGQVWFNDELNGLDIYVVSSNTFVPASSVTYGSNAPSAPAGGDIWINTALADTNQPNERAYPDVRVYNTSIGDWVSHDNTDQTTNRGVLFANVTDTAGDTSNGGAATVITGGPDPLVFPDGMVVVNMGQSKNTVREYDATAGAWRNAVANHADGSGAFGRFAQHKYIAAKMQAVATGEDLRDPSNTFTLLAAPNFPELTDELVALNSDRGETGFIIIDTPMRKNPTEAVNWVQNQLIASENGEDGLVTNNTYSAAYYPAGAGTEPVNGKTVVVPPSHMALYTYAYNDNVSFQWFAPAGLTRGVVQNASSVGYITDEGEYKAVALTQGQRDAMYDNKLNPITTFVGQGTVVFGQKTLHTFDSALDRVNVARLVAYLRERFDHIARPFLFEINDQQTRDRAKLVFERFLADILSRRGIYDFAVVCDETNNTPARIDRNELYIDVAIEPAKVAEFIYIPIRIVNTGTLSAQI